MLDGSWKGIGFSLVRDPIEVRNWYELWLAPENVEAFWNALVAAGAAPVGAEAWSGSEFCWACRGWAWTREFASCRRRQDRIMRCITPRAATLGRRSSSAYARGDRCTGGFTGLIVEGKAPARGSKIMAGDKDIGEVTSSAEIVVDGVTRTLALGYAKLDIAAKRKKTRACRWAAARRGSRRCLFNSKSSPARLKLRHQFSEFISAEWEECDGKRRKKPEFVVTDRRKFNVDGEPRPDAPVEPKAEAAAPAESSAASRSVAPPAEPVASKADRMRRRNRLREKRQSQQTQSRRLLPSRFTDRL